MSKNLSLKELQEQERKLFLGKLSDKDKMPASDKTVGEVKKEQAKLRRDWGLKRLAKRQAVLDKTAKAETQTVTVAGGVTADVELKPSVVVTAVQPIPALEELKKLDTEALIVLANAHGVDIKVNVDNRTTMIAKLTGTYEEPEADLPTNRGELEKIAKELGFDGTDKTAFPNIEKLSETIREVRSKQT